jgi:hypothetical protein
MSSKGQYQNAPEQEQHRDVDADRLHRRVDRIHGVADRLHRKIEQIHARVPIYRARNRLGARNRNGLR